MLKRGHLELREKGQSHEWEQKGTLKGAKNTLTKSVAFVHAISVLLKIFFLGVGGSERILRKGGKPDQQLTQLKSFIWP